MIRILQIGMTPNLGGVETYVMNIYRKIDREKFQFDFIDWYGEKNIAYSDEIKKLGGKIYKIKSRREAIISNYRSLKKIIFSGRYQYIYYNLNSLSYVVGMSEIIKNSKMKLIVHSHNDGFETTSRITRILDNMHRNIVKNNVIRLACSQSAGKWMFDGSEFTIIPNAIDVNKFDFNPRIRKAYREKFDLSSNIVFGCVARFSPQKNHDFLIDIFHKIHLQNPNSTLLLVGDGDLKEQLQQKVSRLNISDSVKFLGMRTDIPELMQAIDVIISPSVFEGFGISVLEAQCTGLRCYVSEVFNDEVIQTPNVQKISLGNSSEQWAQIISDDLREKTISVRKSYKDKIINSGYDIGSMVRNIEKLFTRNNL